ncbi:hypothetical protein [Embleya sp. NPDC059237]|uniref:hypothetical protein n=1 Tax=Embleya sp. NPDC059237 TaxID=3346784 RepID=UPI00367F68C9
MTPDQTATRLATTLHTLWTRLARAQDDLLATLAAGPSAGRLTAQLARFDASVTAFTAAAQDAVNGFARTEVASCMHRGAEDATRALGVPAAAARPAAVANAQSAARAAFESRIREASRRAASFRRDVSHQRTARQNDPALTPSQDRAARAAALRERHPLGDIVYRNATRHPVDDWAHSTATTHTVTAYNRGYLGAAHEAGVSYVEVRDGVDCGWLRHQDGDKANGTIRTITEALETPISHPRCGRVFHARPDIVDATQAKSWRPDGTPFSGYSDRYTAWGDRGHAISTASMLPTIAQAATMHRTGADERTIARLLTAAVNPEGLALRATIDTADVVNDESIILGGGFFTTSGHYAGSWNFDLNPVARTAYLDFLRIESAHRAQGFVSAWTEHFENWLIAQEYRAISLLANIDIGGYAWARNGYYWTDEEAATDLLDELHDVRDAAPAAVRGELDRLLARASRYPFGSAEYPSPWDVSELGASRPWIDEEDRTQWFGKHFLLGRNWYGTKWLEAP